MRALAFLFAAQAVGIQTYESRESVKNRANPIRKVVTLLQNMQKKVTAEGEKEDKLYKKFECYCKSGGSTLEASIATANTKMPTLAADIESSESVLVNTKEELKQAQTDETAAKAAMADATLMRAKEAAAFGKEKTDKDTNIAAISRAVSALEKGMAGGFLQTSGAHMLQRLVLDKPDMLDGDRQQLLAFLSGEQSYNPASGEITGILKQLGDEMSADLAKATGEEEKAIKNHEGLMAAKSKEVEALIEAVETKSVCIGELGVSIVQMKNDLTDTESALIEDKKFLADMAKNCKIKSTEHAENVKIRGQELVALADTIKILNDDDALELFKKTLPSTASFLQVRERSSAVRTRALNVLQQLRKAGQPRLDFIMLALKGKKIGFDKVIHMIDDMVVTLNEEQVDDDNKKEYCAKQLDETDDKKKGLETKIKNTETATASAEEAESTLKEEIKALMAGIKTLDKQVSEATEQRKEESEDYTSLMAQDNAAKELLQFAKNRLNKFYNPNLYKPPAEQQLSSEDRVFVGMGGSVPTTAPGGIAGTGISLVQMAESKRDDVAPAPPPDTAAAYSKKSGENTGVIAMIDLLVADLDKEMTQAEVEEKDGQSEYKALMNDAATQRTGLSKSLTDKEMTLAHTQSSLVELKETKTATVKELIAIEEYISSLHGECDWLMKYFDVRKDARAGEVDALKKAAAVLQGADYSLLQVKRAWNSFFTPPRAA